MIFWVQISAFIHHMEEIVDTQSMVWIYDRLLRKGVYVWKNIMCSTFIINTGSKQTKCINNNNVDQIFKDLNRK